MELEEPSSDSRKTQVKELEQIVKKLQEENIQLLNKVSSSNQSLSVHNTTLPADDNLEDSLLDLDTDTMLSDGEWLYTSPKLCLTPVQKQQSPLQWLSEGHSNRLGEVPSLNEIRKTLVFNIEEAETISKAARPRSDPNNNTAKKYLSRVRERSRSNSPVQLNDDQHSQHTETETGDSVPINKWKPKMPQEENPVVNWKAKMPQEENEDVPVVKWKPKMPQEENGDVPVAKWKPKMPQEENGDVPVVNWKPKMPQEENEDVPVVKWKPKMPSDSATRSKAQGQNRIAPRSTGLMRPAAVKRTEASPTSCEETHNEHTNLKAPVHSELLRQPQTSPSGSPTGSQRRLKIPSGQSLRNRSPSPPSGGNKRRLVRPSASSPSRRSLSPGKNNLTNSPTATKRQLQSPGSPSSSIKHPSGLPTGPKRPEQRMSRLQAHKEGQQITPPRNAGNIRSPGSPGSGSIRTPGSSGLRGPSSLGAGKRGLTPPKASPGAQQRRMLPTPPSAARATQRAPQNTEAEQEEGDTWLEGCY